MTPRGSYSAGPMRTFNPAVLKLVLLYCSKYVISNCKPISRSHKIASLNSPMSICNVKLFFPKVRPIPRTPPGVRPGLYLSDFHWGVRSFDWRLATIAGMEVAKLVPWNSLLN